MYMEIKDKRKRVKGKRIYKRHWSYYSHEILDLKIGKIRIIKPSNNNMERDFILICYDCDYKELYYKFTYGKMKELSENFYCPKCHNKDWNIYEILD